MSEDGPNLISRGVLQGALISCSELTKTCKESIAENRAISSKRKTPVLDDHLLVILSQDCDIANREELNIEVLNLKQVKQKDVNEKKQKSRNTRKLQLPIGNEYWLCDVNLISHIPKQSIIDEQFENPKILTRTSIEILIQWRINRYNRAPLPDKFNDAFFTSYVRKSETGFSTFIEKHKDHIIDLYAFVTPDNDKASEYFVSITALLVANCPTEITTSIKTALLEHLNALHKLNIGLKMIQVDSLSQPDNIRHTLAIVAGPEDFTMLDSWEMRRLTLDYLCWPDGENE